MATQGRIYLLNKQRQKNQQISLELNQNETKMMEDVIRGYNTILELKETNFKLMIMIIVIIL